MTRIIFTYYFLVGKMSLGKHPYLKINGRNYTITRMLGFGSFGMTFEGYEITNNYGLNNYGNNSDLNSYNTSDRVAVKILYPSNSSLADFDKENNIKDVVSTALGGCVRNAICYHDSQLFLNDQRPNSDYQIAKGLLLAALKSPNGDDKTINEKLHILNKFKEGEPIGVFITTFIDGYDLEKFTDVSNGNLINPLSEEDLETLTLQMLSVLNRLHAAGVYHRDVKPANIMAEKVNNSSNNGPSNRVKYNFVLIDFGLSCSSKCNSHSGSPYFMPNESFDDNYPATERARMQDIFGLGMTLYELQKGKGSMSFKFGKLGNNNNAKQGRIMSSYAPIYDTLIGSITNFLLNNYSLPTATVYSVIRRSITTSANLS